MRQNATLARSDTRMQAIRYRLAMQYVVQIPEFRTSKPTIEQNPLRTQTFAALHPRRRLIVSRAISPSVWSALRDDVLSVTAKRWIQPKVLTDSHGTVWR